MLQDILAVAGPVTQFAQQHDQLWMQSSYTGFKCGLFSFFPDLVIHFFARFSTIFDPRRMNAAVADQFFQGPTGQSPADRIEARQDHCFRCIINNQINPGQGFQRSDISPFAADNPSFHFIIGEINY